MTETQTRPTKPADAEVSLARVINTQRISSGFQRITVTGVGDVLDRTFEAMGFDQWLRLFFPVRPGAEPVVAYGGIEGWYQRWLALDESERATIRNYTVRATRRTEAGWEIDIDFVVHASASGEVDGVAAQWALAAQPGDVIGLLDQGVIFDPSGPDPEGQVVVLADETGIPAAEGIAASLPEGQRATFLLDVPHDDDRRALPTAAEIDVRWAVRGAATSGSVLEEWVTGLDLTGRDYVYVVGEAAAVLRLRAAAQEVGALKQRVDFCAYWRTDRRAS